MMCVEQEQERYVTIYKSGLERCGIDGALLWQWVVFREKKEWHRRVFVWHTGNFQGVRKRGRGGRALPRPDRAASLAANTRLFWNPPDWLISRTIDRLHHKPQRGCGCDS